MNYYTPPEELAGTVFDPSSETFGPIMAAIQRGDFVEAAARLRALEAATRIEGTRITDLAAPGGIADELDDRSGSRRLDVLEQEAPHLLARRADDHCFRTENCADHPDHVGEGCCCCGRPAAEHTGCDCK